MKKIIIPLYFLGSVTLAYVLMNVVYARRIHSGYVRSRDIELDMTENDWKKITVVPDVEYYRKAKIIETYSSNGFWIQKLKSDTIYFGVFSK